MISTSNSTGWFLPQRSSTWYVSFGGSFGSPTINYNLLPLIEPYIAGGGQHKSINDEPVDECVDIALWERVLAGDDISLPNE